MSFNLPKSNCITNKKVKKRNRKIEIVVVHGAVEHGDKRIPEALPAGVAPPSDGVRRHQTRRSLHSQGLVDLDSGSRDSPQQRNMGEGRKRVQPGEVRVEVVRGGPALHPVRSGAEELRGPGLCPHGGQDHTSHAALEVPVHHLGELPPRAGGCAHHET